MHFGNIYYSFTIIFSLITPSYGFHSNILSRLENKFALTNQLSSTSTKLNVNNYFESSSEYFLQRDVEIPLIDFSKIKEDEDDNTNGALAPLPSKDLPDEASTLNLYAYKLKGASYERLLEKAESKNLKQLGMLVSKGDDVSFHNKIIGCSMSMSTVGLQLFVQPSDESGLVGGIGVAIEVIAQATAESGEKEAILAKGAFRFVVRKVVSTFPFPTVIVDELPDISEDKTSDSNDNVANEDKPSDSDEPIFYSDFEQDLQEEQDDDDDDDYDDDYDDDDESNLLDNIPPSQLFQQCIQAMKSYVEILNNKPALNPLEKSILEDSGISPTAAKATTEEKSAVLQIFLYDVLPEFYSPLVRYSTTAFLAAEIGSFDNPTRIQMLQTRDSINRLKIAVQALQRIISQEQARKIAEEVTKTTGGDEKDLKVGKAQMPPWVRQMGVGTRVEYYWNEEWGWCAATIMDVQKIVDEYLFTLKFDDDEDGDELRKIPFTPEDKVRWRPISS